MTTELPDDVQRMPGAAALPRDNGELLFATPWEARALALAVTVTERLRLPWDTFRDHLIAAIAAAPERPYYESWASALESFVVDVGLTTPSDLDAATPLERAPL